MKDLTGYIHLNTDGVFEHIKNRPPFLMINEAYVKPGEIGYSEKYLSEDEWYFSCHFPGNPMMPGALQLESMFNLGALIIKIIDGNKEKTTNISKIERVQYKRHIRPKDTIKVIVKVSKFRRGLAFMHGEVTVEEDLCCEADFVLVVLDEVLEVRKNDCS